MRSSSSNDGSRPILIAFPAEYFGNIPPTLIVIFLFPMLQSFCRLARHVEFSVSTCRISDGTGWKTAKNWLVDFYKLEKKEKENNDTSVDNKLRKPFSYGSWNSFFFPPFSSLTIIFPFPVSDDTAFTNFVPFPSDSLHFIRRNFDHGQQRRVESWSDFLWVVDSEARECELSAHWKVQATGFISFYSWDFLVWSQSRFSFVISSGLILSSVFIALNFLIEFEVLIVFV